MASSKLDRLNKMAQERKRVSLEERTTPVDSLFEDNNKEEPKKEKDDTSKKKAQEKKPSDLETKKSATKTSVKKKVSENETSRETAAQDTPAATKPETSGTRKKSSKGLVNRKLGEAVDLGDVKVASWNCRMTEELYLRFRLLMALNNTTKTELGNRIMFQERKWVEAHPEFPDMQFQIEALKKSRVFDENKQSLYTSFALTAENHAFIKEMSSKCLMKMYAYVSWVIEQYCDLEGIPKDV